MVAQTKKWLPRGNRATVFLQPGSSCGPIIFTVVTDQHSVAISVQAVDDVGYS